MVKTILIYLFVMFLAGTSSVFVANQSLATLSFLPLCFLFYHKCECVFMSVLRSVLLVNVFSRTEEKNFNKHTSITVPFMCYCHVNHGWISIFSGTVANNIRYGPQLRGKKLSDEEVYKLLRLADLDPSFFSKTGGELSVGQAQRVALARTLANKPEVTHLLTL